MAIIKLQAGHKYKFTSSGSNLAFKEGTDNPLGLTVASGGLQSHGNLEIISGSAIFDGPISASNAVRFTGLGGTYPSAGTVKTVYVQEDGTMQLGVVGSGTVDSSSGNIYTSDGNLVASRNVGLTNFNLSFKPGAFNAGTATFFIGGNATYENRVGINTETPAEALEVQGTISASADGYFGGDVFVEGKVTADEFHTTIVSTSVNYSTGNTTFGDETSDLHKFTGSLEISGNLTVTDDDSLFEGEVSMSQLSASGDIHAKDGTGSFAKVHINTPLTFIPHQNTDQLIIGSGTGNQGMTIYSGDSSNGSIHFADDLDEERAGDNPAGNRDGVFRYAHNHSRFEINTAGNQTAATIKHHGSTFQGFLNVTGSISASRSGSFEYVTTSQSVSIGTDLDVEGIANLDVVDIDGATQIDNTVTVGVDDIGHDVKFFGNTAGKFLLWDASEDHLNINGTTITATGDYGHISASGTISASSLHVVDRIDFDDNPIVADAGIYWSNASDTKAYVRRLGTNDQIEIGSDADVRFVETDGDTERAIFKLNTGQFDFNGSITASSHISASAGTGSFRHGHISQSLGIGMEAATTWGLYVDSKTQNTVARFVSSDDKAFITIEDNADAFSLITKDAKFHIGTGSTDYENFTVWPAQKRVGINTTTPGVELHVIGDVSGSASGSFGNLFISQSISASDINIAGNYGAINATSITASLGIVTDGQVSGSGTGSFKDLYVSQSGYIGDRLGIGTTAPANPLMVVGSDSVGIDDYILHNGDGDTKFGFPSNDTFKIRVADGDRLYIPSSGDVGIGTTDPQAKLHVEGKISASNDIYITSADPTIHFHDTDGATYLGYVGASNAVFEVRANASGQDVEIRSHNFDNAIYIDDSTSRIGIGIDNPESTLSVLGDISASGTVYAARFESSGSADDIQVIDNMIVSGNINLSGSLIAQEVTSSNGMRVSGTLSIINETGPTAYIKTKVGSFDEYHLRNDGDAFQIYNATDDRKELVADGAGGIGIGVATPHTNGFALQVSGAIGVLGDNEHALGTKAARLSDVFAVQTTVGAIFETGLTTEDIGELKTGTVVVWKNGALTQSYKEQDSMVMGVIKQGKDEPIILGAEPILVTGEVNEGDFLITSDKLGHAKAQPDEYLLRTGTVIAQALESAEGESSLIKGMIRKL